MVQGHRSEQKLKPPHPLYQVSCYSEQYQVQLYKTISKTTSSSPRVVHTQKEKQYMCTRSKPMTHVRVTGEAKAPSSQGEVFLKMSNPKLFN